MHNVSVRELKLLHTAVTKPLLGSVQHIHITAYTTAVSFDAY